LTTFQGLDGILQQEYLNAAATVGIKFARKSMPLEKSRD